MQNKNQSKSLNLNSYNVRCIYIVYILYSKANNNIHFHKSKETQKNGQIYSYFTNWSWCTRFHSIACGNNHKRGENFWLVDNIQNGVLIGSHISMNNLDTQVNLLLYKIDCLWMYEWEWLKTFNLFINTDLP